MFACSSLCLSRCCALVLDLGAVAVWHYADVFLFAVAVVVCLCAVAVYLCIVAAVVYLRAIAAVYLYALVTWLCVNCVPLWGLYAVAICYCMFAYSIVVCLRTVVYVLFAVVLMCRYYMLLLCGCMLLRGSVVVGL